jgi:putative membrane protein
MITWWCVALERPWTWQWIAYPGIWIATLAPIVAYLRAVLRHPGRLDRRRLLLFLGGMLLFWVASDWPLGALGAGYLASAHMLQFLLYTLGSAPLLLLGTPQWLFRRVLRAVRLDRAVVWLGRSPVTCAILYNVILLVTHAPGTVDVLRRNQLGSFAMDVIWVLIGMVLWLPITSPLPEGRVVSVWPKMLYLFLATAVVAVIPASFLTFTTTPVYAIYELAPRIGSLTAREDQQMAGILMKLATIPVVWTTIGVLWFRFARQEEALS